MSGAKKDPKLFRESLTVINHPRALVLPADFFKKREAKGKDPNKKEENEEFTNRIRD